MEADGDSPQLWSTRRHGRTSPILNPEALILAIPILVLLIIFLILPPFLSYTNHQILKPSSVKKGWDSINIFLVLIAVLCGVFAKRNDDKSSSLDADGQKNLDAGTNVSDDNIRKSIASSKWLDFPDKSEYDKMTSSRSYPDLRQESLWGCESNVFKFFDDFEVNFHRQPEKRYHRERRSQKVEKEAVAEPAPPSQPVQRRRSVHRGRNDDENESPPPPAAPSLQLPPPEPEFLPVAEWTERIRREKSGATKEIATATASLQYGTQTQRKKKEKSRDIYVSATEDSLPPSAIAPPSTPPPPPPPPPSKGFQSLLKKSSKSKRVHSVSITAQPPPPPPPPPPNSIFANIFKTGSKSKRSQLSSASSHPPPPPPPYSIFNNIFSSDSKSKRCQIQSASSQLPPPQPSLPTSSILISSFENLTKTRRFKNSDTPTPLPPPEIRPVYTGKPPKPPKPSTSSHNETDIIVAPSPLIPMPPPPPPLSPFRMPEINFVPNGDFDRKGSTNSSKRSSPKLEDVHVMSIESESGQSIRPSVSCPSPDVNTKADTFISRLRDGWRLEKLNSINERQNSVSTSNRL